MNIHTFATVKNISYYIDAVFCLAVLPVMALIFPIERWYHNFPGFVLSFGIWLYVLYFANRFITVPSLYGDRKAKFLGAMLIAASIVITYAFSNVTLYTPKPNAFDEGIPRLLPRIQQYQQAVWSLFMIVAAFSFAVSLLTQANIQKSRRRAIEAERDKAEIELYKAQIKPHFMFNTLNSLYGLFLTKDANALASLEKFIAMMRYMHTSSMRDFVPLADELDYIRQYVGLQSLRLSGMTNVSLEIDIGNESLLIPPMLLTTFVENCFKHGVSPVKKSDITICIREKDGKMVFTTSNRIFPVKRIGEHIGIGNCRRRLELLYPSRHDLSIENSTETFDVKLKIDLSNDEMCCHR